MRIRIVRPRRAAATLAAAVLLGWVGPAERAAQAQQPPVVLGQTPVDAQGERVLSAQVNFAVPYPDAVLEGRRFKYSTPENYASYGAGTVNLWLVFHGGGGSTDTMNRYFDIIPASAPTVLVFPEALPGTGGSTVWRGVVLPGDGPLVEPYRDVVFVEQLRANLLGANPQLHPGRVYASGFSSGGNMTWMLLCYRSSLFRGFGMFSKQLGRPKRDEGCGNGRIQDAGSLAWSIPTGYELLTGNLPDRYGHNPALPAGLQASDTKAAFYSHGTFDDNLEFAGTVGCSSGPMPTCPPNQDPAYSMDPGGPNEDRDDISTMSWLLARHDLLDTNPAKLIVPDENLDPLTDDLVVTTNRTYSKPLGSPGVTSRKRVRWLELASGIHALSALDHEGDNCPTHPPGGGLSDCNVNPNASKDYETSTKTREFFEGFGGMLTGVGGDASGVVPNGTSPDSLPLTVAKAGGGDITLAWDASCSPYDEDYEVYEGSVGGWYSHAPVLCTTGAATTVTIDPSAGSRYYLAVPRNGAVEGSYGLDGDGAERPASPVACRAQVITPCQ